MLDVRFSDSEADGKSLIHPAHIRTAERAHFFLKKMCIRDRSYVDGMVEREKTFSTFMGNGLALPHGVEAAKKEIKSSGIAVLTFPEGTDWDGNKVNVVIGIAGVGEEHLDILSVIADKMMDETAAEKLATGDVDTVYEILGGK